MRPPYTILLFPLLLLFVSCQKSNMAASSSPPSPALQQDVKQESQIIFVNLEITEDTVTQEKSIALLNSIMSGGKLKNKSTADAPVAPGDMLCSFLSGSGEVLYSMAVPNPLEKTFEYASEDGILQKKKVKLAKATITLRAPLEPGTTQLRVQQLQENLQLKNLHTINLSL